MTAVGSRTLLAGSSYGGLASATIALRCPESFGNVVSLSGSYWWSPEGQAADKPEYVADWVASAPAVLNTSRHLRDVLQAKDYEVTYRECATGHDYYV